ncbi:hypothetical protein SK128_001461 [Halocaridina rubra]|uniref:Uncharacterized protein n=1 Tax=Halocaridina rubra TaxID=373956 RepID=A0AAN8ZQX9_HALRR
MLLRGFSCQVEEYYLNTTNEAANNPSDILTTTTIWDTVEPYTSEHTSDLLPDPISTIDSVAITVAKSSVISTTEPLAVFSSPKSSVVSLSNLYTTTQKTVAPRGDMPLQLDSEENMIEEITQPIYVRPISEDFIPHTALLQLNEANATHDISSESAVTLIKNTPMNESTTTLSAGVTEIKDTTVAETLLVSTETPVLVKQIPIVEEFTTTAHYDLSQVTPEKPSEDKEVFSTTQTIDLITVFTPSHLKLHDKWIWFYLILRGNCYVVDITNSEILFHDFIHSLSDLLLYNREHILIDSMTCTHRRMTVNMSIDSLFYPNCEKDLRTLLTHKNLRLNLHDTSFYIHSYETKRTLMFESKQENGDEKSDILYMTLGGVGVSLIGIMIAGALFSIYQCCVVKKTKHHQRQNTKRFMCESPRSLQPKYEIDQSMSFSDQMTYSVNMYKSYSDLTVPDLYSHLGSPNSQESKNETSPKKTTILTRIPKEKKKKKKCKKNYGLNDCEAYQEYWSETVSQTNEDFMTIRNLNTMTSSFKGNMTESEKEVLNPLLKQGMPLLVPSKYTMPPEDLPPPPPPPPPKPQSTTCPSSPAISRGVLDRMDHLIFNGFSNSTPDINTTHAYTAAISNATINMSSASSAILNTTTADTTNLNYHELPPKALLKTAPLVETKVPSSSSASAENLCLTRITFMGMDNPYFRMETDM